MFLKEKLIDLASITLLTQDMTLNQWEKCLKIWQIRRLSGDIPPEFLLTHPVTSSRISDAFNAADQVGVDGGKTNSPEYQFIKGRIQAKYFNRNANAEAFFKGENEKNQPSKIQSH